MRFRRGHRSRRFGPIVVHTAREEDGVACGSVVRFEGTAWRVPAWPHRIADARPLEGGSVALTFRGGAQRLLEPEDAA